jgi:hypothetical protein
MDFRKMGWKGGDRMHLAQDRDQWRAVVNTVSWLGEWLLASQEGLRCMELLAWVWIYILKVFLATSNCCLVQKSHLLLWCNATSISQQSSQSTWHCTGPSKSCRGNTLIRLRNFTPHLTLYVSKRLHRSYRTKECLRRKMFKLQNSNDFSSSRQMLS